MARQVIDLQTVLAKVQTAAGVMETTLTSADWVGVIKPQIQLDPEASPIEIVGAGFGNMPNVIGPYRATAKMSLPIRILAQDSPGHWTTFLKGCGWGESGPASHVYTYTPSNLQTAWKNLTLWGYTGNMDTTSAILRKVGDMLFGGKIILDFEKSLATFEVDGKGRFSAAPAVDTQPTITRDSVACPPLRGATISIMGSSAYVPLYFELDFSQDVQTTLNPAVTGALSLSVLTKRAMKWVCRVYKELPATADPIASLLAGTTAAFSIAWNSDFTVAITAGQITKVVESDQNGIETYELSGEVINNGATITVDTTT
jgi:hypothetical protein